MTDDLTGRLRSTTEQMANRCSVDAHLWNVHSNAALEAADEIERVRHLRDKDRSEYFAEQTLDSERKANARLTEENERLQAENKRLKTRLSMSTDLLDRILDDVLLDGGAQSDSYQTETAVQIQFNKEALGDDRSEN